MAQKNEKPKAIGKTEIEQRIAVQHHYYQCDVKKIMDSFIGIIQSEVIAGRVIRIPGLGTFTPGCRKWRGKDYPIAKFSASPKFKAMLRQKKGVK
jgi:hypothetical protein